MAGEGLSGIRALAVPWLAEANGSRWTFPEPGSRDAFCRRIDASELRGIEVPSPYGPVPMATLRDPDGVLVEIIGPPRRAQ